MELDGVIVHCITEIRAFYTWTKCVFQFHPRSLYSNVGVCSPWVSFMCASIKSLTFCMTNRTFSYLIWQHLLTTWQQTCVHTCKNTQCTYYTDAHAHHFCEDFGSSSRAEIFCSSHSWREILNNKYPANNECAAGCSCLGGIISNFLPMFHIPTPACRHSPSLHSNAGSYHFYLFFKSIYKSKPGQMRSNKLQSAGQM